LPIHCNKQLSGGTVFHFVSKYKIVSPDIGRDYIEGLFELNQPGRIKNYDGNVNNHQRSDNSYSEENPLHYFFGKVFHLAILTQVS